MPTIECIVDFPDDQIEVDSQIVREGGLLLAETIRKLLKESGFGVSPASLVVEHGWQVIVQSADRRHLIQVTDLREHMIIHIEDVSPFWIKLYTRNRSFKAFSTELFEALRNEPRISSINWIP
jgi:hypothetical protein